MPKLRLPAALAVILICSLYFSVSAQQASTFKLFFEKTYLHTDRDVYTQGDTLWFKAYLVNAADNKLIGTSNNLHVELIDAQAHIRGSEVIRLDGGTGKGDFELNDTIPAGTYQLRAYTNWMRNFGDNFFFEKIITLLPAEQGKPEEVGKTIARPPVKPADIKNTLPVVSVPQTPSVRFFPEGGSLVEGVGSIIAVKAEGANGTGVKATGAVLSSAGDTVAHFTCDTLGMGLFTLLPIAGQHYKAVTLVNGKTVTTDLPAALKDGLSLHIRQSDSLLLAVISGKTAALPFNCRLVVRHGGVIQASNDLQLTGQQLAVRIPTTGLPQGVCAITIYDAEGKPHCERLVYIHHPQQGAISLKTDKKDYQSYTPTTLNLHGAPGSALSVAVVDSEASAGQSDDIVSYLMLGSELRGHVDHAARYFDTTNINRYKQLDMLLLTQGWRDFVWRRMADTAIHISYGAESGIVVSGRLKDETTKKPMPGMFLTLFAPNATGIKTFSAISDSSGRFSFDNMVAYGKQQVRFTAVDQKGVQGGSFSLDTVTLLKAYPPAGAADLKFDTSAVRQKRMMASLASKDKVTNLKEVKVRGKSKTVVLNGGKVFTSWGPDQVFNITPADEKFKTLTWYLLQNAKGAMQAKPTDINPGADGVEFMGVDTMVTVTVNPFTGQATSGYKQTTRLLKPLIFINDRELYMDNDIQAMTYIRTYYNMPITKFKKIVLKRMVGSLHTLGWDGRTLPSNAEAMLIDRYLLYLTMDEDAMTDNPGRLTANVQGYYEARDFYTPTTANAARNLPYRPTIHWEPLVKTDNTGNAVISYFNAEPGDVKVIVQGIGADGIPLISTVTYAVK
ncbi:hypothetical protein C8P68_102339 [Mucilaginibacter yixingensis]|uniref:MG2 domain-containing protein n=1 Tax=Mucilaginibacter yixingensis TaxID=1295612 RepID=A0A2T5JCX4_9SPHI|nr:hypothetical protein [Mucilaginibacter yixingensis]PTQ99515.1 hypothetical protein C8P68_102339 [Mucilaginibacter yixingensis]